MKTQWDDYIVSMAVDDVGGDGLFELVERFSCERVPVSVFSSNLSPSEALVSFLKSRGLRFVDIARLLNRDQRGVWCSYRRACSKGIPVFGSSGLGIPCSVFADRRFSVLEHVVRFLRLRDVRVKRIAEILGKSPSTIAAVHFRVRGKQE